MKESLSFIFVLFVFLISQFSAIAQDMGEYPPEPMTASSREVPGSDCVKDSDGSGPSVPVGLCLPINDYIFPLFISGIALGAFSLFHIQQKREAKNFVV